jgi:NAD(P)-dependent dehydrogenase (short-subunit alcohol dehydrogenase family)
MPDIHGSKAIVVGGTHGIGLATAQLLISKGATVMVTGRNLANLESAKEYLGNQAVVHECDITFLESISTIANRASEAFGGGPQLDLLFINAGYASLEPWTAVSEASFRRTFDTNVFGAFFVAQTLSSLVKPGGAIVFTTSISNRRGIPGMSVYSASKAAVHSFVQTLAAELAPKNIRVNAVSPGYIKTPTMGVVDTSKENLATFEAHGIRVTPLGRIGNSEEVAKAVAFLGYEATYTTGSEVLVDGGLLSLEKGDH